MDKIVRFVRVSCTLGTVPSEVNRSNQKKNHFHCKLGVPLPALPLTYPSSRGDENGGIFNYVKYPYLTTEVTGVFLFSVGKTIRHYYLIHQAPIVKSRCCLQAERILS